MSRFFGRPRRAPLAIATVLACPLFFAALMASTLAVEHPHIQAEWINHAFWAKKSGSHPVVVGKTFLDRSLGPPTVSDELFEGWLANAMDIVMAPLAPAGRFEGRTRRLREKEGGREIHPYRRLPRFERLLREGHRVIR